MEQPKKYIKVNVSERLPAKNGNYEVITKPFNKTCVIFEKGNKHSDKFWNEKVEYFIEEKNDFTQDFLQLLNEMYNDLEIPIHYQKRIKSLIQSVKQTK